MKVKTIDLTLEEIRRFIDEKWENTKCRRCGNDDWNMGGHNCFKAIIPVGADNCLDINITEQLLPAAWFMCRNCGSVEFVGTKVIRAWKSRN